MDARFYNSDDIDIERLASDLVSAYLAQGYLAQQVGSRDQVLVQIKRGGDFQAIIGMQAVLSLTLQRTSGGVLAMIGQQRWVDKAAVGAVGIVAMPILWPLAITAGVGALRQASLGNQVLNMVDGLVRQQKPGINVGPVPSYLMPQVQQGMGTPPADVPYYTPPARRADPAPVAPAPATYSAPGQLRCTNCNTPYEPGDTFCTGCGRPLSAPRLYCQNCNTEIKPGVSFCPKCGASTFSTVSATQQAQPRPAPTIPAPTVTYTPASPPPAPTVQSAPLYTPPAQPKPEIPYYTPSTASAPPPVQPRPETPVYTPPPAPAKPEPPPYVPPVTSAPVIPPQPTVYYIPSGQTADSALTVTPPPSAQPTEPYYVPPVTQEPTIKAQPKVTIVPGTPHQEPPPPQRKQPQKQYYIPSNQAASEALNAATQTQAGQSAQSAPVIKAQPVSQAPQQDLNAVWGTLLFSDGQQVQLKGESAVVGRYDHDLGGIEPQVDLAQMPGADTVSRVHAMIEPVGSTYMLTDLNSTNATRINGKRLEPDKAMPIQDGDTLLFGKVTATFKKA